MAEEKKDKDIPETQVIKKSSDIKSPLNGFGPNQVIQVADQFGISFPFQYVDGEECPECLQYYAKQYFIDGKDFKIVPSAGALRIYSK